MLSQKPRLTADPTVGVGDLLEPLKTLMEDEKEDNLMKLIEPPSTASWKSGCPTCWLASLGDLFKKYVKVAPNSIISSKKHKTAIERLAANKKINFTRKSNDDFVDAVDDHIRIGLSHLRQLKQDPKKKEQAFRNCDREQQRALDDILDLMNVDVVAAPSTSLADLQMVPYNVQGDSQGSAGPTSSPACSPPMEGRKPRKSISEDEAIFDAVLGRGNDDEKEVEIKILKTEKKVEETGSPTYGESPQRNNMFSLNMSKAEQDLLQDAHQAPPFHEMASPRTKD